MKRLKISNILIFAFLTALSFLFLIPIITVVANSFKDKFSISQTPFVLPNSSTFVGVENYISGVNDTGFISAFFLVAVYNGRLGGGYCFVYCNDCVVYNKN